MWEEQHQFLRMLRWLLDYGQIVKTYSVTPLGKAAAIRYSPAEVVAVEKTIVSGAPDVSRISTSHVEKQKDSQK